MKLHSKRLKLVSIMVTSALLLPTTAFATNGYFSHGYGTKNKGLAGGGVALPQDAMIAATNPAGMVYVGERMDVGVSLFSPSRTYNAGSGTAAPDGTNCNVIPGNLCPFTIGGNSSAQSIESGNDFFLIPHFAYNWVIDPDSTVGVSVYGNGGMNSEYEGGVAQHDDGSNAPAEGSLITTPGTFGAGTAGVNLEQLFINASYARKYSPEGSWGASLIYAYQKFEAKGLANFGGFSTDSTKLTNNGDDTASGFGVKFGIQHDVTSDVTLAASYQSEMDMDNFDKYKGLFAEQGDFDIPATWTLGLAWKSTADSVLTFDVQQIMYGDIAAMANPISYLVDTTTGCAGGVTTRCLGGSEGAGFGWEDMTIFKLGYQWTTSPDWTWRVGASVGDQPIPASETMFNILAPAVIETHLTFGFTTKTSANSEFNLMAMYAPNSSQSGASPLNPGQNIEIEMTQYEVEASWGWKF